MTRLMTAVVRRGKEDLKIEPVPVPKLLSDGVPVRIGSAWSPGTDIQTYRPVYPARRTTPPANIGRQLAGVAEAVGAALAFCLPGLLVHMANRNGDRKTAAVP